MATAYAPTGPLSSVVEYLWIADRSRPGHSEETVLPSGRPQLLVDLGEEPNLPGRARALFTGIATGPTTVATKAQGALVGVVFRPNGLARLVPMTVAEFTDEHVAVDSVWSDVFDVGSRLLDSRTDLDRLHLLERELTIRIGDTRSHVAIDRGLRSIDSDPGLPIDAVRTATGLSHRRFVELFKREVGVTPKRYARIRRFQRALAAVRGATGRLDWASVALDAGYYDQSHLVNEFREFGGMTPTEYVTRARPHANHVAVPETGTSRDECPPSR